MVALGSRSCARKLGARLMGIYVGCVGEDGAPLTRRGIRRQAIPIKAPSPSRQLYYPESQGTRGRG